MIVIDALDECGEEDGQSRQRETLLHTLCKWRQLPNTLKLIVMGRNERVTSQFTEACESVVLHTGRQVTTEASGDIWKLFTTRLERLRETLPSLSANWPGEHKVGELTRRAAGLFIWAETAIRYIEMGDPDDQLDEILSGQGLVSGDALEALYEQIGTRAIRNLRK